MRKKEKRSFEVARHGVYDRNRGRISFADPLIVKHAKYVNFWYDTKRWNEIKICHRNNQKY